ncbi:MAG: hypothetical protein C0503_00255 [Gemmatimonas sp.]|nr:hypothetical protein [Gemmatimonas sp.]
MRSPVAIELLARRALFAILAIGVTGTLAELLLLKHFDGVWQLVPVTLLGSALALLLINAMTDAKPARLALVAVMALFVAAGVVGLAMHLSGNMEWELERAPELTGWPLLRDALMGATPALAPGAMIQLGLIGLLHGYLLHRELRRPSHASPES